MASKPDRAEVGGTEPDERGTRESAGLGPGRLMCATASRAARVPAGVPVAGRPGKAPERLMSDQLMIMVVVAAPLVLILAASAAAVEIGAVVSRSEGKRRRD
jgi:hypothetical protein